MLFGQEAFVHRLEDTFVDDLSDLIPYRIVGFEFAELRPRLIGAEVVHLSPLSIVGASPLPIRCSRWSRLLLGLPAALVLTSFVLHFCHHPPR